MLGVLLWLSCMGCLGWDAEMGSSMKYLYIPSCRLTTPRDSKDVGRLQLSHTAVATHNDKQYFLKKVNTYLMCNLAIPLLGIHPRERKHMFTQGLAQNFQSSLLVTLPKCQQPQYHQQVKRFNKMLSIQTMKYLLSIKRNHQLIALIGMNNKATILS